jgi:phage repressor protein C with HTH and peptisase S24 domain
MFTHEQLWSALDALAKQAQLTPSGLARRAGLDPTIFNKSKRFAQDGRPRWPSTESLAKVLEVTGSDMFKFAQLLQASAQIGSQEQNYEQE